MLNKKFLFKISKKGWVLSKATEDGKKYLATIPALTKIFVHLWLKQFLLLTCIDARFLLQNFLITYTYICSRKKASKFIL